MVRMGRVGLVVIVMLHEILLELTGIIFPEMMHSYWGVTNGVRGGFKLSVTKS